VEGTEKLKDLVCKGELELTGDQWTYMRPCNKQHGSLENLQRHIKRRHLHAHGISVSLEDVVAGTFYAPISLFDCCLNDTQVGEYTTSQSGWSTGNYVSSHGIRQRSRFCPHRRHHHRSLGRGVEGRGISKPLLGRAKAKAKASEELERDRLKRVQPRGLFFIFIFIVFPKNNFLLIQLHQWRVI
jgi:hypothetical protein